MIYRKYIVDDFFLDVERCVIVSMMVLCDDSVICYYRA